MQKRMKMDLVLFLKAAEQEYGMAAVFEMVKEAMIEKVTPESLDAFFKRDGSLRGAYDRARNPATESEARFHNLASCIRKMGLEFTVDTRHAPWNRFNNGSTVVVVIGVRRVTIEEVSVEMKQKAVGARDMESLIDLTNLFGNEFRTGCKIELQLLPPGMSSLEAETLLSELRQRKDLGAIAVLGSPVTNRMCDPMARSILEQRKPPALFRWSHTRGDSTLSDPKSCQPGEEGIRTNGVKVTDFPRAHDDEVLRLHRAGRRGPFPDCGILMMDCRVHPYLILAAGHGGCGTKACVRALGDQEEIAKRLSRSGHKLFEVIVANRMWRDDRDAKSSSPTDNLDLTSSKGWSFGWESNP